MDMTQLKEYVALEGEKKDLDAKLKTIAQKLDDLEAAIVPQMIADGVQSMKVDGRTIYLSNDIYAGPRDGDKASVIDALKAADDTAAFVAENYSPQTLKSFVRELAKDVEATCKQDGRLFDEDAVRAALPAQLAAALKISFVFVLRSRKA